MMTPKKRSTALRSILAVDCFSLVTVLGLGGCVPSRTSDTTSALASGTRIVWIADFEFGSTIEID